MRNLILFVASLFISDLAISQESFQVNGVFHNLSGNKKVIMYYRDSGGSHRDTALVTEGKFSISGKVKSPVLVNMFMEDVVPTRSNLPRDYAVYYLEPGTITIMGYNNLKTADITGGPLQKEYSVLQDSMKRFTLLRENISGLWGSKWVDDTTKARLQKVSLALYSPVYEVENRFIASHPGSIVSWNLVADRGVIIDPDNLEPAFNLLSDEVKQRPEAMALQKRLELAKRLKVGNPAIDFTSPDVNGVPVSLSSYKGKYVLIDFWASWCGPCRGENPHMLKAYNNLKGKNFEIFGVSLDDSKEKWLKAIEEDKLPWTQVSDLKGFRTVAETYGIRAIPQNLLLDPNGIIVAKNLRGEKLEEMVRAIMNKK